MFEGSEIESAVNFMNMCVWLCVSQQYIVMAVTKMKGMSGIKGIPHIS